MTLTKEDLNQIRFVIREEVQAQLDPIKTQLQTIEDRLDQFWETIHEDTQLAIRPAMTTSKEVLALKKRIAVLESQHGSIS